MDNNNTINNTLYPLQRWQNDQPHPGIGGPFPGTNLGGWSGLGVGAMGPLGGGVLGRGILFGGGGKLLGMSEDVREHRVGYGVSGF